MRETQVQSLGVEDPLEKGMAPHPSIPAWRSPWTEEAGRLQSKGSTESDMTSNLACTHTPDLYWVWRCQTRGATTVVGRRSLASGGLPSSERRGTKNSSFWCKLPGLYGGPGRGHVLEKLSRLKENQSSWPREASVKCLHPEPRLLVLDQGHQYWWIFEKLPTVLLWAGVSCGLPRPLWVLRGHVSFPWASKASPLPKVGKDCVIYGKRMKDWVFHLWIEKSPK